MFQLGGAFTIANPPFCLETEQILFFLTLPLTLFREEEELSIVAKSDGKILMGDLNLLVQGCGFVLLVFCFLTFVFYFFSQTLWYSLLLAEDFKRETRSAYFVVTIFCNHDY